MAPLWTLLGKSKTDLASGIKQLTQTREARQTRKTSHNPRGGTTEVAKRTRPQGKTTRKAKNQH